MTYGCECTLHLSQSSILKFVLAVMPAKTVLFDHRAKILHDFGTAFCNFISFNPQGRLLAIAGFGNLAGKVDIYDRRTLNKVTTIDASNTSHCEWSPDGRFLLTATLSPRLRVDNGIKIWHCTGPLVHVQPVEELYQASWRPTPVDALPAFPPNVPPAPAPARVRGGVPAPSGDGADEGEGATGSRDGCGKVMWMPCTPTVQSRYDSASSKSVRSDTLRARARARDRHGRPRVRGVVRLASGQTRGR